MADDTLISELAEFVDFTDAHASAMADAGPLIRGAFPSIVDRFYAAIENSKAAEVFESPAQVERLKLTLNDWLERLVSGVYDLAYLERRARIGRVHVRIGLDQRYMFAAMNVLRVGLHEALESGAQAAGWAADQIALATAAIDKLCDIELAIMLETYREAYSERLRASERLATIGQLAASLGHELRNPLAVIDTSRALLERRTEDERTIKHVGRIGRQVKYAASVIEGLLSLTRDDDPVRQLVHVRPIVGDAVEAVRSRPGVAVETNVPDGLPRINLDPTQLRQVLINLLSNAAQAMAGAKLTGTVTIRARAEGRDFQLLVVDQGPGIPAEVRNRLFEPLFTTRVRGIGLGLALCKRIVEKHGGSLTGRNDPEGGAIFMMTLPGAVEE